jgi:hypothetical protein
MDNKNELGDSTMESKDRLGFLSLPAEFRDRGCEHGK